MKLYHLVLSVLISPSLAAVALVLAAAPQEPAAIADESLSEGSSGKNPGSFSPYVDRQGNISLPQGFRQKWAHLGSWASARKQGSDVFEMHDVYTSAETISSYNETGRFPDGAVLVKEVRETKVDRLTTGHTAWSTDEKLWFVMVKDQVGRFQASEHWGDGWGWALFEAKDPTRNVSAGYDTSCLGCHSPVEDTDWVYTYGYPELTGPHE